MITAYISAVREYFEDHPWKPVSVYALAGWGAFYLLFLLYAGFNTNACIINRDYGTIRMRDRGYRIILIRDCTTGMESKDTQATMAQTNGTILNLEMFGCFTIDSGQLINP